MRGSGWCRVPTDVARQFLRGSRDQHVEDEGDEGALSDAEDDEPRMVGTVSQLLVTTNESQIKAPVVSAKEKRAMTRGLNRP